MEQPSSQAAAAAARESHLADALQSLAQDSTPDAVVLSGLHAHAAKDHATSCRLLQSADAEAAAPPLGLEDWRLYLVAGCLEESGGNALAPLETLLEQFPNSPLVVAASLARLRVANDQPNPPQNSRRQLARARRLVSATGSMEDRRNLARLAWKDSQSSGSAGLQRAAARTLLTESPEVAAELGVLEALELRELPSWLTPQDRLETAGSYLRIREAERALRALETVSPARRSFDWHLLRAEVLVALGRETEALANLETLRSNGREETPHPPDSAEEPLVDAPDSHRPAKPTAAVPRETLVSCAMARAALRARSPHPRRRSPPRSERETLHQRARSELAICADGSKDTRSLTAWRELLQQAVLAEDWQAADRALQQLPPDDAAVLDYRWQKGWQLYLKGETASAILAWEPLNLSSRRTWRHRGARYWTAQAELGRGELEAATSMTGRLVHESNVSDFYRQLLTDETQGSFPAATRSEAPEPRPWPRDPLLLRTERLVDLGLEPLALVELDRFDDLASRVEGVYPSPNQDARSALRALALANRGRARASILPLLRAFPELGTAEQETAPLAALDLYYPLQHLEEIETWSRQRGLDVSLVLALIRQESAFDSSAVSRSGARGLMQLMVPTARELAQREGLAFRSRDLHDPEFNVRLASRYLRQVLDMFDGNVYLALAGYNAGPYRIRRWWREAGSGAQIDRFIEGLPMEEPRIYVKRILLLSDTYRHRLSDG